ncbi:MAG: alpha/beta fold hydrolase [Deltaproteobacteria bacterium]|nr:alpha/beta fold hydrolase [Deltaproteobacteria bacterium]
MRIASPVPTSPALPHDWPRATLERSGAFQLAIREANTQQPGPPMVLVHGLGSSSLLFARAWGTLAERHRLLALDLPGCGETRGPKHRMELGFHVEHVLRLLDRRGIERAHWVGHSMGAHISLWAALHHPERVAALSLISPAGIEPFDRVQRRLLIDTFHPRAIAAARPHQLRSHLEQGFHRMPPEAEWLHHRRVSLQGGRLERYAHAFSRGVRAMLDAPVHHRLTEIEHPTLLAIGAQDALVPNRFFRPADSPAALVARAQAAMPRADARVVDGAGHLLPFERPADFVHLVSAMHSATAER